MLHFEAQPISHEEAKISRYLLSLHHSQDLGIWLRIHQSDPPTPEAGREGGIGQNPLWDQSDNTWGSYIQILLLEEMGFNSTGLEHSVTGVKSVNCPVYAWQWLQQ